MNHLSPRIRATRRWLAIPCTAMLLAGGCQDHRNNVASKGWQPVGAVTVAPPNCTTQPRRRGSELIDAILDDVDVTPAPRNPVAHERLIQMIRQGKGVNVPGDGGLTPLQIAATFPSAYPIMRELGEHGAIVNAADSNGETALHTACELGRLATVQYLLEHGADPNARTLLGETPLHFAAGRPGSLTLDDYHHYGTAEALRELLVKRATDPKIRQLIADLDSDLLHAPTAWDRASIAKALISAGSTVNLISKRGETPLDIAQSCNAEDSTLRELLVLMGGRPAKSPMPASHPHSSR